jgi:hypothetical protein
MEKDTHVAYAAYVTLIEYKNLELRVKILEDILVKLYRRTLDSTVNNQTVESRHVNVYKDTIVPIINNDNTENIDVCDIENDLDSLEIKQNDKNDLSRSINDVIDGVSNLSNSISANTFDNDNIKNKLSTSTNKLKDVKNAINDIKNNKIPKKNTTTLKDLENITLNILKLLLEIKNTVIDTHTGNFPRAIEDVQYMMTTVNKTIEDTKTVIDDLKTLKTNDKVVDDIDTILQNMDTGDLVLFCGKNNLISRLISYFTNSQYTHVGFVLKNPTFCNLSRGVYLWMSGNEGIKDVTNDKLKYGVQIVNLKELLNTYIGEVYLRKLSISIPKNNEIYIDINSSCVINTKKIVDSMIRDSLISCHKNNMINDDKLHIIYKKIHNATYDYNPIDWIKAYVEPNKILKRTHTFWCSAFVAYLYVKLGIMDTKIGWSLLKPSFFGNKNSTLDNKLIDFKLSDIIPLKIA